MPYFVGELKPHQAEAVARLRTLPRGILADDVGLGKTPIAVAHICELHDRGELGQGRPVWFVTASALVVQALSEIEKFAPALAVIGQQDPIFYVDTDAKREQFHDNYPAGVDIVVVSHDQAALKGESLIQRFGPPAMIVIDEASALKNRDGVKNKAIRELTRPSPYGPSRVLAMTATPLENNPVEPYALLALVHTPDLWSPDVFDRVFVNWSEGYVIAATGAWVEPKPVSWKLPMLETFRDYWQRYTIRRTAEDVGLPLPRLTGETYRFVPLTGSQARAYAAASRIPGRAGHVKRTQTGRQSGEVSALIEAFLGWFLTESGDEKVIVRAETLSVVQSVCERLDELGVGNVHIEGSVKMRDRAEYVARFKDPNSDVRVLVGSKVLEYGLNLQTCRILVSLDTTENPQREAQAAGRVRRIGSPHETYQHLVFMPDTPTAHKKVALLQHKSEQAELLHHGAPVPSL